MAAHNRYIQAMEQLVSAVSDLSLARDVAGVREVVRSAARQLTGADGATFILREGEQCHYVDEDAIGPLWKGKRFPMSACISGWVMLHKCPVVLEDIYSDPRIPDAAYRPTFVRSLAMVPIRADAPIGAIGCYWASQHTAKSFEVKLLQALADSTSVALETVRLHQDLEARVRERTEQLEATNAELEAFSGSVSHDLRAPLRAIKAFSSLLLEGGGKTASEEGRYLQQILKAAERMDALISDLLGLSRASRLSVHRRRVDLTAMARDILQDLRDRSPQRSVNIHIAEGLSAVCDDGLIRIALENLFSNAWKFTGQREHPTIEFGVTARDIPVHFVRDNGAGFDMSYIDRLFTPFQRLHTECEFSGTGLGLATVRRAIDKHGGAVWAESAIDRGSTFFFTLDSQPADVP